MKELIIEEKARAYDYALAKARDMLSYKEVRREDIEYLFPELIESEDEKIRKELIDYHRSMAAGADDYMHEAWIAWLEKQKEYESTDFDYVWETTDCSELTSALDKYSEDAIKKVCHAWYDKGIELERKNWLEKQGEKDNWAEELNTKIKELHKQCLEKIQENMPTIVWHSVSEEPEEMKELFCEWESDDATWHDVAFYDEESHTFRHAKMPINVTKWVYVDELLKKQVEQKPIDKVEPRFKVKYAGSEYNVFEVKDIAGVSFYGIEDEHNHIDYVRAANCERVDNIKENGSPFPIKPAKFSKESPACSEEDSFRTETLISVIKSGGSIRPKLRDEFANWLKSIKDRVQPKQEWSEEDKRIIDNLISQLGNLYTRKLIKEGTKYKYVNWLKSLKDKITWKPSEEQMEAVANALSLAKNCGEESAFDLRTLYEQLKKL